MKKWLIGVAVMAAMAGMLVLAVGCTGDISASAGGGEGTTASGMSSDFKYKGSDLTLTLEENPTTGYQWVFAVTSEGQTSTGLEAVSDEFKQSSSSNQVVGAPGKHEYKFKGVQEGTYWINFTYSRSWEPSADDETCSFEVTVGGSGNITKVEQKGV